MARLKCHGRELLRISKEQAETNPESSTTWNCRTRAYMADGKVLEKFDVRFKPDQFQPRGEFYSYGWKLAFRKKPNVSLAEYEAMVQRRAASIRAGESKWTIVNGGPPPVVISQARILAACESGNNIGFCKSCGAEADGCEPDARNYRCESCGMSEVYGAEEFLIGGAL